jgi:hypothetical protein
VRLKAPTFGASRAIDDGRERLIQAAARVSIQKLLRCHHEAPAPFLLFDLLFSGYSKSQTGINQPLKFATFEGRGDHQERRQRRDFLVTGTLVKKGSPSRCRSG